MQRDRCVVQFNLRVTLGFRLDEYLSSPPINHTVLTSGRVINTALDWCEIKNAIVLSIRVVVVLLVLEGTEAHQPRSPAGVLAGASESFTPPFEAFRLGSRDSFEIKLLQCLSSG